MRLTLSSIALALISFLLLGLVAADNAQRVSFSILGSPLNASASSQPNRTLEYASIADKQRAWIASRCVDRIHVADERHDS